MYSGYGFHDFEIGDVDVVEHEGLYHLFHLVLPNHSYIAHAVSEDGLSWRRVKNALFISDPVAWDDDMLWTMHVSPNPYKPGAWRMFYTGLCMSERGRIQRIGLAHSSDLYTWHKDASGAYPLEIPGTDYEHSLEEGRHWVSFRDPFCFQEDGKQVLLASARVNRGPVIRRGCVSLARETDENHFEFGPPLFHPMHYDDMEVPNLIKLSGRYYLISSIREHVKVHYWVADKLEGPYGNFYDNVLLPQGNYSARVSRTGNKCLVWNFFYKGLTTKGQHMMAPPKELEVDNNGQLHLKSFTGFDKLVAQTHTPSTNMELQPLFGNPHATGSAETTSCWFGCDSGFEAFLMPGEQSDFRLTGKLTLEGHGKCGLVLRLDEKGDGYYLSLDLFKGIAQIRAWGQKPDGDIEDAFHYQQLQAANYVPVTPPVSFVMLAYGQYLEFSLNGHVLLTLADDQYSKGRLGFYVESAQMRVDELKLDVLETPVADGFSQRLPERM